MRKVVLSSFLLIALLAIGPVSYGKNDPTDQNGKVPLEKITFVHYKKNPVKTNMPAKSRTPSCYAYIASGAKWKTVEPYEINTNNSQGLTPNFITSAMSAGVSAWENAAGVNIFGEQKTTTTPTSASNYDESNLTYFAPYSDPNVIAVTTVWGYFNVPPKSRQIIEWDMQFNSAFTWGDATVDSSKMDLQNIATHELGHSAGMGDLYTTSCTLETMYGYSSEGDVIKRNLYNGDIAGIQALY